MVIGPSLFCFLCYSLVSSDSIEKFIHLLCWKFFLRASYDIFAISFICRIYNSHQSAFGVTLKNFESEVRSRRIFLLAFNLNFRINDADSRTHFLHLRKNEISDENYFAVVDHCGFLLKENSLAMC